MLVSTAVSVGVEIIIEMGGGGREGGREGEGRRSTERGNEV
jgi:hypothetical protein